MREYRSEAGEVMCSEERGRGCDGEYSVISRTPTRPHELLVIRWVSLHPVKIILQLSLYRYVSTNEFEWKNNRPFIECRMRRRIGV